SPEMGEILYMAACLHKIAKRRNDPSICKKITKKDEKWSCLVELSKDEEICNEAENRFWRDYCLVEVLKNELIEKSEE
ncbi:MAG: hypothetical protein KAU95_02940, partial [Candidatus Aenigmarchaeota archaeon]|nr:hypothetical protein [Candidatus Aenigmarchaeota archaeon]